MTLEVSAATSPGGGRPATASAANARAMPDGDGAVAVRVAVHIRPLVEQELDRGCQTILDAESSCGMPRVSVGQHAFSYDAVYGACGGASSESLYGECVAPLVDGLFRGYNATVFAYGQTGSGKTYTMGSSWSPDSGSDDAAPCRGVIPAVMDDMFARVQADTSTEFSIKVSFVEIHKARGTAVRSRARVCLLVGVGGGDARRGMTLTLLPPTNHGSSWCCCFCF